MSGKQQMNKERKDLEELKWQMETSNVAPADTLGFGRSFAEIISRIGNLTPKRHILQRKEKVMPISGSQT